MGIVGISYGDGLPRVLNQARVWYEGAAREILGRVSMDSIAIDLGDAPAEAGAPFHNPVVMRLQLESAFYYYRVSILR